VSVHVSQELTVSADSVSQDHGTRANDQCLSHTVGQLHADGDDYTSWLVDIIGSQCH